MVNRQNKKNEIIQHIGAEGLKKLKFRSSLFRLVCVLHIPLIFAKFDRTFMIDEIFCKP